MSDHELIRLIYKSTSCKRFSINELLDLSAKSSAYNRKFDITGVLVYVDKKFLQVLEGEASIVKSLFFKIDSDARHIGVEQIICEPLIARTFTKWNMGMVRMNKTLLFEILESDSPSRKNVPIQC